MGERIAPAGSAALPAGVVALVTAAVLLNYVDRGALSVAAPLLVDEFHISPSQMGLLLSAFFWTYGPAQLAAGWLVHRFDVRAVLAVGVLVWGLATAATGLAQGFVSLLVLRLLLGLGESVLFPGWQMLMALHVPPERRGGVNGFVSSGQGIGPMLGTLAGGLLVASAGWRALFVVLGAITVLWVWPWWRVARSLAPAPHAQPESATATIAAVDGADDTAVPYRRILRCREFWGASLGHFAANYAFYFLLTWLPTFLVKAGGYTLPQMGAIGAAIYGVYAAVTAVTGAGSDALIRRGLPLGRVRQAFQLAGALGTAATIAGCAFVPPREAVWLLIGAGVFFGLASPMTFAVSSTLAGPRAAGRWAGAQNLAAQVAGVVAPFATGVLVERTGTFVSAFACAALVALLGVVGWCVVVRRVEPVRW